MKKDVMKDTGNSTLPEDEDIEISIEELIDMFIDFIPLVIITLVCEQHKCHSIGEFTLALNRCLND